MYQLDEIFSFAKKLIRLHFVVVEVLDELGAAELLLAVAQLLALLFEHPLLNCQIIIFAFVN
jgi:hypothetical protein